MIAFALAACGWNHLPSQEQGELDRVLWDAKGVVPTADGLYVPLPYAGALALVAPGKEPVRVDVGEGRVGRVDAARDGRTVIAFVERYVCRAEDPRDARRADLPDDCKQDELEVLTDLALVSDGKVRAAEALDGAYNATAFSEDGRYAVAYLDFSRAIEIDSVLNLTGVVVIDLSAETTTQVPVGFAADRVLFVEDDAGAAVQAVVLSRNEVAVVDLLASPPEVTVTFPLTLDPDQVVDPVGIDLTPDGRYALISARGSSDLYALDLDQSAINIVELASAPSAMAVSPSADRTVFVYGGDPVVELMDHQLFDVDRIALDEAMDRIALTPELGVLYGTGNQHDVYRVELATGDVTEYRLQNPAVRLELSPTNEFAVALTRAEGGGGQGVDALYDEHPGMEIVDLRSDESTPFVLEGQGLGVAFSAGDTTLSALVLQDGIDYLYRLELYTLEAEEIEVSAPPVAIGEMPDGSFYVTHDRALGLVSFLDPDTGRIVEVSGFATLALADEILLQEVGR